ncbi:MAG: SDR family oxidoreductase [Chitinophaga sp.]|uniref:SDR family oxidoreductase n=1 Tax=Chitinophaga sp. TaxID=1869181 RepID=UPI001B0BD957|nr:SDR family oxidoreductase [Chitinophaga sp.]MBO9727787.1 SDR family oxidoreductase [Chitinophaga sp.]
MKQHNNRKVALIVGAQGVIGRNLSAYLEAQQEWDIIGLSRRGGEETPYLKHIAVDLMNEADTQKKLGHLTTVTHIFYAAYQDAGTWAGLVAPNMTMLQNVVNVVEPVATQLQHISLMQGYKVYGAHLGPFKTPARESDAGTFMPPEFNMSQQHFLEHKQRGKSWTWSAIRPSVVGGFALGNPMNLAMVIAVYAAISKELGLPLRFPGKPGAYHTLMEMTDANLLAKATAWAATNDAGANSAFNINNGDLFRWSDLWPRIARYFDMEVADPLPIPLAEVMADKAPLWNNMMEKYGLQHSYEEVSSWKFGDFVFSWDYDFFADGSKARRAGFHEFVDTAAMFMEIFDNFKKMKVIP